MFSVFVDLWIKPGQMDEFLPLIIENAARSVAEEIGCLRFDVVRSDKDPDLVVLYELYATEEAFADHLMTDHFGEFDVASAQMLQAKSIVKGKQINARS